MPKLRIGIDARLAGTKHGGIGRYIQNLLLELPGLTDDVNWVVFFHDKAQADEVLTPMVRGELSRLEIRFAPVRHYTFAEQLQMPAILAAAQLDLLHVPHFNIALGYQGKLVITIHDLLWHEQRGIGVTTLPAVYYWLKHWVYGWVVRAAITRAKQILVPAETIKQTVARFYPQAVTKVAVTPEGIGSAFAAELKKSPQPTLSQLQSRIASKTLVYVGSLYPHKNVEVVLQALQQLPDWKLILVGSRSVFQEETLARAQALNVATQVEWKGFLSDQELVPLLQRSMALVQPSLSEGFGLTGVEAMACGVSVIASDIPIFHEVYQDGAIYFSPQSAAELVKVLSDLEAESIHGKIMKGLKIAAKYQWRKMAEETNMTYMKVLKGG